MQLDRSSVFPAAIVICTVDRCESLRKVLENICNWRYLFKELIIVRGPCTDETDLVLKDYQTAIDRVVFTSSKNVSIARNIGLKTATQEIIFYLDDDVIPTQNWLESHFNYYQTEGLKCGCVAGSVRDRSLPDLPLQFHRGVNSLFSESKPILTEEAAQKYLAKADWFAAIMGANVSYRREALERVGGFDEFFAYFLEETDICLRIIQAGYQLCYTDNCVAHYPAQSHNRHDRKHLTCWYELAKNTTYFALKHAYKKKPFSIFIWRLSCLLIYRCLLRILRLKFTHQLPNSLLIKYIQESIQGVRVGWSAGLKLEK